MIPTYTDDFLLHLEARRLDLTHDRMVELANHPIPLVRLGIAWNNSAKLLVALAEDENEVVREGVAKNPYTSPETLAALTADICPAVRRAVERNPNTPPLVKLYLQSDYNQGMTLEEFLEASQSGKGDV